MTFNFSPYAWLLIGNSGIAAGVAYLAYRRREKYAAWVLFWLSLTVAWWSAAYGLHVAGNDFETQYFFNRIKYLGAVFTPPLWFLLAYAYTHPTEKLSPRKQALILSSTAIFLPFIFLDSKFHTWWTSIEPFRFGPERLFALKVTHSIFFVLLAILAFFWVLAGVWLYSQHYLHHPSRRRQIRWVVLAGLLPLLGNAITQLGLSPLPWGLDPFLFTFSLFFLAIAILKEQFLDPLPIAHRLIIEQLPQGIIVVDEHKIVVDINPAALRLCPHATPKAKGKPLEAVVGDETLRSHMLFALHQQPDELVEVTLPSSLTLSVRATPIQVEGEARGHVIILEDISRQKRLQEELAKARDMAVVASTLKSRLLATATKDIRHPAGMVVGYLESLLQGVYGPLSNEQKQAVAQALEQGNQMIGFLNNLMGYAEIESGAAIFHTQPFSPNTLIEAVQPLIDTIAHAKNLETQWEIDPALPTPLHGDVEWLTRVLFNLLNNAMAYTSRGFIRTRLYRVDDEHWAIEVEDTGRGISPQRQKQLFDLQHAHGLGLTVARGLVEHMGGNLKFNSVVGRGSTFTVVLPLTPPQGLPESN